MIEPYAVDDRLYIDGAVLDRIPVELLHDKGADQVIAVDVKLAKEAIEEVEIKNIADVVFRSMDLMEREIARHCILKADVVINPKVGHIGSLDYDRAEECIDLGLEATKERLPSIKKALGLG